MPDGSEVIDYCRHPEDQVTRPRRRVLRNGTVQFWRQCLVCGGAVQPQCARAVAMKWTRGQPLAFDETLRERYWAEIDAAREKRNEEWHSWYAEYLKSCQWRELRYQVLERCGYLCEGCRMETAIVVHHLNYDHVGRELLYELVGLCKNCHDRAHAERNQTRPFLSFPLRAGDDDEL